MPEEPDPYAHGQEHLRAGLHEEALSCFEQAVESDPADAKARCDRGLCLHHLGEYDLALADYDEALRLDPDLARAYVYRGSVRRRIDPTTNPFDDYDEAVRRAPDMSLAWSGRGRARFDHGDHGRALEDLDRALELDADDPDLHVSRSHALAELDRLDESVDALDQALRLDPTHVDALQTRALRYQERGDYDAAGRDLAAAHEHRHQAADHDSMTTTTNKRTLITGLLRAHFAPASLDDLTIVERVFPYRMRADLQRALDGSFGKGTRIDHFGGLQQAYDHDGLAFAKLIAPNMHDPATAVPPQYEEMDIGERQPLRCLKNGLWLLTDGDVRFAVLLAPDKQHGEACGVRFQIAARGDAEGTRATRRFFEHLEDAVERSDSYRGKVLSLESDGGYFGRSIGLRVHRLRTVARDDVILPATTLELLDRNVLEFARQRDRLRELGLSTKKGLLFYGPPGTGKTHTLHYLADALEGHTVFLVTAEQIGYLDEYVKLARLLQPSVLVLEDVDLIAEDRRSADGCSPVLLHKLMNEMDGLRPDADILFILTTNRPESLERALTSRPGRIDQAIEFPYPDEDGRAKLVRLYSFGLQMPDELVDATVRRTEGVSASFLKELMRRAAQFQIERGAQDAEITPGDIDAALEELLVTGGSLNRRLLGTRPDDE